MIDETLEELRTDCAKANDALKRELSRLRTGRANADMLDAVRVDYYGTPTPLRQMATVAVPEPRMITVKPWDKTQMKIVEKAIVEADLGINPQPDGDIIRLPMPPLTEQRRKEIVKIARKNLEDAKVAIRKARHDAKDMIDTLENDGDVSEDECDRARKKLEEMIQSATTTADEIVARKEKDILEI